MRKCRDSKTEDQDGVETHKLVFKQICSLKDLMNLIPQSNMVYLISPTN